MAMMMSKTPHILVFDSGLGGLTVLRALRSMMPKASYTYLADDAGFPYGDWLERKLVARIVHVLGDAIERERPNLVVIACNTASTLALSILRSRFDIPFVGTVPAIKPAAEQTHSGLFSVLATPGTIARDYTRALIDTYAFHCDVALIGSKRLAGIAERYLRGETIDEEGIAREIRAAFVTKGNKRTDVIALGCTHYPLLLDILKTLAPWPVQWIDPSLAIARRAHSLLYGNARANDKGAVVEINKGHILSQASLDLWTTTSGTIVPENLRHILKDFGLAADPSHIAV